MIQNKQQLLEALSEIISGIPEAAEIRDYLEQYGVETRFVRYQPGKPEPLSEDVFEQTLKPKFAAAFEALRQIGQPIEVDGVEVKPPQTYSEYLEFCKNTVEELGHLTGLPAYTMIVPDGFDPQKNVGLCFLEPDMDQFFLDNDHVSAYGINRLFGENATQCGYVAVSLRPCNSVFLAISALHSAFVAKQHIGTEDFNADRDQELLGELLGVTAPKPMESLLLEASLDAYQLCGRVINRLSKGTFFPSVEAFKVSLENSSNFVPCVDFNLREFVEQFGVRSDREQNAREDMFTGVIGMMVFSKKAMFALYSRVPAGRPTESVIMSF